MKKEIKSFQNKLFLSEEHIHDSPDKTIRDCPECGLKTIKGMPGGRDATCKNCGYKDPCCYD